MKGCHNKLEKLLHINCKYIQNKNMNDLNGLTLYRYVLNVNYKFEQKKSSII